MHAWPRSMVNKCKLQLGLAEGKSRSSTAAHPRRKIVGCGTRGTNVSSKQRKTDRDRNLQSPFPSFLSLSLSLYLVSPRNDRVRASEQVHSTEERRGKSQGERETRPNGASEKDRNREKKRERERERERRQRENKGGSKEGARERVAVSSVTCRRRLPFRHRPSQPSGNHPPSDPL